LYRQASVNSVLSNSEGLWDTQLKANSERYFIQTDRLFVTREKNILVHDKARTCRPDGRLQVSDLVASRRVVGSWLVHSKLQGLAIPHVTLLGI
jgi:hypothetical protein